MDNPMSTQEQQLCQLLMELPSRHNNRYSDTAERSLINNLFWSMACGKPEYMRLFFPAGDFNTQGTLKLREAHGTLEGAEYTEAARGKACGHVFRSGEASYGCRTCSNDDTCCLCSKCFDATDHTGHMVRISISPGNSGCCDCGDPEAWKVPLFCTIHTAHDTEEPKGKEKEFASLPEDLVAGVRMTVARVIDFICDVISCAPEEFRQPKTRKSIELDEKMSRLNSTYCGGDTSSPNEWTVLLWNDEKHTVVEVQEQVARACRTTLAEGYKRALETDSIGRAVLMYGKDLDYLLRVAKTLEQIKIVITIRSSRDTFREQMCGAMISWLNDIAGCYIGPDSNLLRVIVCEELLQPWRQGSPAIHAIAGKRGIEDEQRLDYLHELELHRREALAFAAQAGGLPPILAELLDNSNDEDDDQEENDDGINDDDDEMTGNRTPSSGGEDNADDHADEDGDDEDVMMVDAGPSAGPASGGEANMGDWRPGAIGEALEEEEATMAGYPPPPPPPPAAATRRNHRDRDLTPSDSDTAEPLIAPTIYAKANMEVPKTIGSSKSERAVPPKPGRYWVETPPSYMDGTKAHPHEDVFQRVRLDWLILFDLRMWKKVRNDLRTLYISTVVTVPEFKRILGLRFAALYTTLAQLYLIGDREPDHSIINISLQMLTTASITAETVERGNFLTTLMAILYTFLTTREVGHPWDVSSSAVLGFDTGSVTNRRMYHFYVDMRYLFNSPHVQERMRTEERYLLQFLDLVKLHQGICPNVRAVGEHVEYETDSWIGASLMTREINKLCKLIAESFRNLPERDLQHVSRAIRTAAKSVIINSIGAERSRFTQAEIKDEIRFKTLDGFEFAGESTRFDVVKFDVEQQAISFHHALHYTMSWLIECGKNLSAQQLTSILSFTSQELKMKPKSMGRKTMPKRDYDPQDYLIAAFDYPLRVCVWLAQIKATMWVRNGISLRHQAVTYRNILHREVTHHRDIFLLQTAMVVCNPERVLASIIDRFGMAEWMKGRYEHKSTAQDETQRLDLVEDMIQLLIVILSDRTSLMPVTDDHEAHLVAIRRDITHVLCFKPLSFNELGNKLPDRYNEHEDFHRVLEEVATFKPPEGVSDNGTFELKPQLIEDIDPYIAHYNKNQREESEAGYRQWMAKKTGKPVDEIVYEPKLRAIPSGAFMNLAEFTSSGMFAQIIYYALLYPLAAAKSTPTVPFTRVETFLQVVLHLILIAIAEDQSDSSGDLDQSFVYIALTRHSRVDSVPGKPGATTIAYLLEDMSTKETFKACHTKLALILKRMRQKLPMHFDSAFLRLGIPVDRIDTASPANSHNAADEERERKKKAALDRQARVMAQFQQQQKNFIEMQGDIDWGEEDLDDMDEAKPIEERKNFWKYPRGTCILCQEDTDDGRLYGTFGLFLESRILRQTDFQDPGLVREVANTPDSLDRSAEDIRPFGLAHENRQMVEKTNWAGEKFTVERQVIGKGFPSHLSRPGPVAVGCGHIMHFSCFEMYLEATQRRHVHQIARHHPEFVERLEFVCPLCKALGNAFLPITFDGKEEAYPGVLANPSDLGHFLDTHASADGIGIDSKNNVPWKRFMDYARDIHESHTGDLNGPFQEDTDLWEASDARSVNQSASTPFSGTFAAAATPQSVGSPAERPSNDRELVTVYRRLRETLRKNKPYSQLPEDGSDDELAGGSTLAQSVGFSISATEIQQRGIEAQFGMTLIEKIPEQTLTQLRILSETTASYISVGCLRHGAGGRICREFLETSSRQHIQLFFSEYTNPDHMSPHPLSRHSPLLSQDSFLFLCETAFGLALKQDMNINDLVRLCYLAEIVKVVFHMSRNMPAGKWFQLLAEPGVLDDTTNNFVEFCRAITFAGLKCSEEVAEVADNLANTGFDQASTDSFPKLHAFVKKYALVFLRKTAILLHVHYGVDFNSNVFTAHEADELTRLTAALRLPSFDEMCTAVTSLRSNFGWPARMEQLVLGWIRHQTSSRAANAIAAPAPGGLLNSALLSHPGIFELVGMPKNYDSLIDECSRRRCPSTGKDLADPILCLMCGDIFCGQTMCCLMDWQEPGPNGERSSPIKIGGAQQHMRFKCQRNIGIFMNIRKCSIFYLHLRSGSFSNAPYIDKYGEVDVGLRHGRQLFLNQKRYDSTIRSVWLSHGVPSFISRRLEADINNGGWETV